MSELQPPKKIFIVLDELKKVFGSDATLGYLHELYRKYLEETK